MTLANMRAQGVRSLRVVCDLCHHEAANNVDRFGEDVPAFGPRMVCTRCGIIGAFVRLNARSRPWTKHLIGQQRRAARAVVPARNCWNPVS
jgi:hypothetical protein